MSQQPKNHAVLDEFRKYIRSVNGTTQSMVPIGKLIQSCPECAGEFCDMIELCSLHWPIPRRVDLLYFIIYVLGSLPSTREKFGRAVTEKLSQLMEVTLPDITASLANVESVAALLDALHRFDLLNDAELDAYRKKLDTITIGLAKCPSEGSGLTYEDKDIMKRMESDRVRSKLSKYECWKVNNYDNEFKAAWSAGTSLTQANLHEFKLHDEIYRQSRQ